MTGWQVRLASLGLMMILSYALEAYALHLDEKAAPCGCGCGGCAENLDELEPDELEPDELEAAPCGCGGAGPCVCAGSDLAIFETAPVALHLDAENEGA